MLPIVGNRSLLSVLFSAAAEERPAGCYVIAGERGSGKRTAARLAAAAFCCENRGKDGAPCLACRNCRNVMTGVHVDVRELFPAEGKKLIPVEEVRLFLRATYVSPTESDWRAFIVDMSAVNTQGQNAMLKSIEEVRPRSVFFLLTDDLSKLLPTVLSRSVVLHTEELSPELIRQELLRDAGQSKTLAARAEDAARMAGGSLGRARALFRDDRYFAEREQMLRYFAAIGDGAGFTKLSLLYPPGEMQREGLADFFTMACSALRDLLVCRFAPENSPVFFPDDETFRQLCAVIDPGRASELYRLADEGIFSADSANVFMSVSFFHLQAQALAKPL